MVTIITLRGKARPPMSTLMSVRSPAAAATESHAGHSSHGARKSLQVTARARSSPASRSSMVALHMSRASNARTNRAPPESHQAAVSQHLACYRSLMILRLSAASHLRNGRRRRPASRLNRVAHLSPANPHNRVNPLPPPINPELRPRRLARRRAGGNRSWSGPPRPRQIAAMSK
jgi:hypothetical protein